MNHAAHWAIKAPDIVDIAEGNEDEGECLTCPKNAKDGDTYWDFLGGGYYFYKNGNWVSNGMRVIGGAGSLELIGGIGKIGGTLSSLTKSQWKSIDSYFKQISAHKNKLAEYIKNPSNFDNKGFLKNAPSAEVMKKIITSRINHLKQEIKTFRNNIDKIIKENTSW